MNTRYKINASIDYASAQRAGISNTDGYSVYDYFDTNIMDVYQSREMAAEVAESGYKGSDVDGVGCTWEIIEVDADSYEPTGN